MQKSLENNEALILSLLCILQLYVEIQANDSAYKCHFELDLEKKEKKPGKTYNFKRFFVVMKKSWQSMAAFLCLLYNNLLIVHLGTTL